MATKRPKSARYKKPEDLIPWGKLSDKQQAKFETAFMESESRQFRLNTTLEGTKSSDFHMAELLRLYSESSIQTQGIVMSTIKSHLALWLMAGRWDKLKWLSEYGKKHASDGIAAPLSFTISPDDTPSRRPSFPKPATCRGAAIEDVEMAELILLEFIRLSGCSLKFIRLNMREGPPQYAIDILRGTPEKGMRKEAVPAVLPTKGFLEDEVLRIWKRSRGKEESSQYHSLFSRTLAKLGLSGLPKRPRGLGPAGGFAG